MLAMVAFGILFALSAYFERRVFTERRNIGRRFSVGLYFIINVLCVLSPKVVSVALKLPVGVYESAWFYAYVASMGLLAPWLFRRFWRGLPGGRIAILFGTSLGMALLSALG